MMLKKLLLSALITGFIFTMLPISVLAENQKTVEITVEADENAAQNESLLSVGDENSETAKTVESQMPEKTVELENDSANTPAQVADEAISSGQSETSEPVTSYDPVQSNTSDLVETRPPEQSIMPETIKTPVPESTIVPDATIIPAPDQSVAPESTASSYFEPTLPKPEETFEPKPSITPELTEASTPEEREASDEGIAEENDVVSPQSLVLPGLTDIIEIAKQDGKRAAEILNAHENEPEYILSLNKVLSLYYTEDLTEQLSKFLAGIGTSAQPLCQKFKEAAVQRKKSVDELGFIPGEVIISLVDSAANPVIVAERLGCTDYENIATAEQTGVGDVGVYKIPISETVESAIELFSKDFIVESVTPNSVIAIDPRETNEESLQTGSSQDVGASESGISPASVVALNDEYENEQWYLDEVRVREAWDIVRVVPHNRVRVAVIDSGVDGFHPDLRKNLNLSLCVDARNNLMLPDITDERSHGTHVAGIIGATSNNYIGIAGVASGANNDIVEIISAKTAIGNSEHSVEAIIRAIYWSIEKNVKVINLSLGGYVKNLNYERAIDVATDAGITVIGAAGNDNTTDKLYPADFKNCVSVIALDKNRIRADFSNYKGKDISAPGVSIVSTIPSSESGVGFKDGTSMATPIVSGIAAMMYSVNPGLSPAAIKSIIIETATDIRATGYDDETAHGLINAYAAIKKAYELSNTASTVPDAIAPDVPTGLCAYYSTDSIAAIAWDITSNADGYEVYRSVNSGDFELLGNAEYYGDIRQNLFLDTTVISGDTYRYKVRAYRVDNSVVKYSDFTNAVLYKAINIPAPPNAGIIDCGAHWVELKWDELNGVAGYEIMRSTDKKKYETGFDTIVNYFKDTYLESDKPYYYRVRGFINTAEGRVYGAHSDIMAYTDMYDESDFNAADNSNGTVTLNYYYGSEESVYIPKKISGKVVTAIGENVFANNTKIKHITLPDTIKSIGKSAFEGCTSLRSVALPDGLIEIGESAFKGCTALYSAGVQTAMNLGTDLIAMEKSAGITKIVLPSNLKSLGKWAFNGCTSIISAVFPVGLDNISMGSFEGCTSLESVVIGGASTIDSYAFTDCISLSSVTLSKNLTFIGNAFTGCESLKNISLPDGLKEIEISAFENCKSLEKINLPQSLKCLGSSAFAGCESLKSISIPSSIDFSNMDMYTYSGIFRDCKSLADVKIADGLTEIPAYMFSGCVSLKSVDIPESVKYVCEGAFFNCTGLESITLPETVEMKGINDRVFYNCISLKSVVLPKGNFGFGSDMFYNCTSLVDVTIPEGVEHIGFNFFEGCTSLKSISIPSSVGSIGASAFSGCSALEKFEWVDCGGHGTIYGRAFQGCSSLKSIIIPDNVHFIYNEAFSGCTSLSDITIPSRIEAIYDNAFENCGLTSLTIPDSLYTLGNTVIAGCKKIQYVKFLGDAPHTDWQVLAEPDDLSESYKTIYLTDKTGFANPWRGYPAVAIDAENPMPPSSSSSNPTFTPLPGSTPLPAPAPVPTLELMPAIQPIPMLNLLPPSGLKASSIGKDRASISWGSVDGASGYELERSFNKKNYDVIKTFSALQLTDKGLLSGNTYYYRVRAYKKLPDATKAYGGYSPVITVKTSGKATTVSKLPVVIGVKTVVSGADKVKVSWGGVKNALGYEVHRSTDGKKFFKVYTGSLKTFTNGNLKAGTKYYYKVRPLAKSGTKTIYGGFSSVVNITTKAGKPAAVTGVNAKVKGKNVVVTWTKTANVTGYEVYRSINGKSFVKVNTVKGPSYTDTKANAGAKYYYKVRAYSGKAYGGYSKTVSVTTVK